MSTSTSLGRTSMMVPRTISPAAKRLSLCFRASSMVSIMTVDGGTAGDLAGEFTRRRLHCLTDQALQGQRRLKVRLYVDFRFSALMNFRTRGVQATGTIGARGPDARTIFGTLPAILRSGGRLACCKAGHLARRMIVREGLSVPRSEMPFRAARCRPLRQPRWRPLQPQASASITG